MSRFFVLLSLCACSLTATLGFAPPAATAQGWPEIFNPFVVRTVNLQIDVGDWNTIRFDQSFSIEVPAELSLGGEAPVWVAVRRKSADALPSEEDPQKISMKVDINEIVPGQTWHDLKKLSLENGDDVNVVTEGFSWYMHGLAYSPEGYSYQPGMAAWVKVYVNGDFQGVYINVEQVDKQYLKNRSLWVEGDTWLYKADGTTNWDLREGGSHSATYNALCYSPFPKKPPCSTPDPATVAAELPTYIDMKSMLTLGAVNAFCFSPDNLFSKGKNFFVADYSSALRMFLPWDLDSSIGPFLETPSIYNRGSAAYEDIIIDNPTFRAQYDQIVLDLFSGPLSPSILKNTLTALEVILTPCLSLDPNTQIEDPLPDFFNDFRTWIDDRRADVFEQLPGVTGVPGDGTGPGINLLQAFPNPFRLNTSIRFHLEQPSTASLSIYDISGRRVWGIDRGTLGAGEHNVTWDGSGDSGERLSGGVYFMKLTTGEGVATRPVILTP